MRRSQKISTASSARLLKQVIREMVSQTTQGEVVVFNDQMLIPLIDHMDSYREGQVVVVLLSPEQMHSHGSGDASENYQDCHGCSGTILKTVNRNLCKVKFDLKEGMTDPIRLVGVQDLFIPLENQPIDWRPEDGLPEDYYAL